jgi:acyl-CoA reductase-like NAD-dependent aldehyde dehydrogenase
LKKLEALNNGKTFKEARDDIEFGSKTLEYYAGWADKVTGKTIPAGKLRHKHTHTFSIIIQLC